MAEDNATHTALTEPVDERAPTVIVDGVHIVYRINGTGSGQGSATAALNRILRPKQAEKASGMRTVHAVKSVSFVAYKGEAVGLIGTNGSGKSTLLKAHRRVCCPPRTARSTPTASPRSSASTRR